VELTRTAIGNYTHPDDPGEAAYKGSPKRLSVTDDECEILARLAQGRSVLEIGTGLGVSTRAMSDTARRVVTVDPDDWVRLNVWESLPSNVAPCNEFVEDDKFDFAFIDGDHHYDSVKADLVAVRKVLRPFSPVVMHDYNGEVRRASYHSGFILVKEFHTGCDMVVGALT